MAKLYLHIGHVKTGTTAIQEFLTANREELTLRGYRYPITGDDAAPVDRRSMVPVGNGRGLLDSQRSLSVALHTHATGYPRHDLVYSSETMFDQLRRATSIDQVVDTARESGFEGVEVLLFVRNPISHGTSFWHQRVKGWQGEHAPLDDWLADHYRTPVDVLHVYELLNSSSRVNLTVRNYSDCQQSVLHELCAWLGVSAKDFTARPPHEENRSLTAGEAVLQTRLNRLLGASGNIFAFRVTEEVGVFGAVKLTPSIRAQEQAWARLSQAVDQLNAALPYDARYAFDQHAEAADLDSYAFSEAQLIAIADGLGEEIARLRRTSVTYNAAAARRVVRRAASAARRRLGVRS